MSKEISQDELAEALEHTDQHPVNPEEFELDEEWIRRLYEKLNKSASIIEKAEQNENIK